MRDLNARYPGLQTSIFAGAFVFGIVMSSLGAILPGLFEAIGFRKVDAGRLFLVMTFGRLGIQPDIRHGALGRDECAVALWTRI